jgi:hypothetical protein
VTGRVCKKIVQRQPNPFLLSKLKYNFNRDDKVAQFLGYFFRQFSFEKREKKGKIPGKIPPPPKC